MILLTVNYKKGVKSCDGCINLEIIPKKEKQSLKWNKHPRLPKCLEFPTMINQIRCIKFEKSL